MNEGEPDRRIVDGRFELESRLGGGGMGTVWRAQDLLLHRYVAVKEVRPPDIDLAEYDPAAAEMLRQRVLREARALARVEHPNVVTIHHIVDGGEGTYPWLVMELVQGGSLADRLARGPMAPAEAARLGRGVLDALNAAHEAGVQHRDVKPANVLLRTDGRPVLTDFGIAAIRDATALTATGSIIGTPDYMAPERVSGHSGGPSADLWSLAMMLYVAVEGYHPLQRGTTLATLAAVLQEDVPPPVRAGSLTPVLSCVLVRDPEARPDAGTVGRMLDVAAAQPEDRRPETTSYRIAPPAPPSLPPTDGMQVTGSRRRPPKRNRGVTVASSVVGVVLIGTLAWKVLPGGNENNGSTGSAGATGQTQQTTPTVSASESNTAVKTQDMLTPSGIRTAIKAFEKKTGSDRFASLSVYPGYVIADVMVKGSKTKYDSYTYRSGTGFDDLFDDKGTLSGGDQPVKLDDFDWDVVPQLLKRANKDLKVEKPTSRYLLVRVPSTLDDEAVGMSIYLSDDYGSGGFMEATPQGKVTRVEPADG